MGRRDKVLAALVALYGEKDASSQTRSNFGFTTDEIAKQANILRTNCSAELNTLVRDGKIIKRAGRPTRYILSAPGDGSLLSQPMGLGAQEAGAQDAGTQVSAQAGAQQAHGAKVGGVQETAGALHSPTLIRPAQSESRGKLPWASQSNVMSSFSQDDFDWGVATQRSLQDAVQQAKMALTYPPSGMHVLLLGETGVGKSTFSRKMHQYAVQHGILPTDAPFVSFNCSEYAYNPEILLDQVFGHVRGAYTGAHSEKAGLVEQANGGMLFLDEVHRLSPQGQEMLFHLIDYGQFRRLGETQITRQARVLLVAATTEAPESSLLSTFRRRIPVVIRLPSLRDWSLYDRYELVYTLCREEARVLGKTISISAPALDKLLFSRFSANIGDLKNTLKLACARAYNGSATGKVVSVLPEHVFVAPQDGPNPALLRRLAGTANLVVTPDGLQPPAFSALAEGSRYAKLDRLSRTLHDLGFATEEILAALERELLRREEGDEPSPPSLIEFQRFAGDPFFTWMTQAWLEVESSFPNAQSESAFVRVGMHLFGVIRSGMDNGGALPEFVERVQSEYREMYRLAHRLLRAFSAESGVFLPPQEVSIVALLLQPTVGKSARRIGVVVALMGEGIARQMVDSAIRIAGSGLVVPVDVAVHSGEDEMDKQVLQAIRGVDEGAGVLILTDVARLMTYTGPALERGTTLERVFRPDLRTVVHALQAIQSGVSELQELSTWLRGDVRDAQADVLAEKPRIVWACCLTGKGTARAVERLIGEALPVDLRDKVKIVPMELARSHGTAPMPSEGLVAAVGSVNPGVLGVPFFSVEELLSRDGIDRLLNVLYVGDAVTNSRTNTELSDPKRTRSDFPSGGISPGTAPSLRLLDSTEIGRAHV